MSLLVWLPLNGNLNNQGLSNLTFVNRNISFPTGQGVLDNSCAYHANNTSEAIVSNQQLTIGTQQSLFCWVKAKQFNTDANLTGLGGMHRYYDAAPSNLGLNLRYINSSAARVCVSTAIGTARTYDQYYGNTNIALNQWVHVGYTYDGTTLKLYLNGQLDGTYTLPNMVIKPDYVHVMTWSLANQTGNTAYSGYSLYGYMQDFRLYNHVLSAKEINEISQGLLVHYKFDNTSTRPYILTNGTQYSDLGWGTTEGIRCEYVAAWTATTNTGYMIGSHSPGSPYGRNGAYCDIARNFWELGYGETCPANTTYERTVNKVYTVEFSTLRTGAYLKVNGDLLIDGGSGQATSPNNLYLFTNTYSIVNGNSNSHTIGKLYSCKIWDKDGILRFQLTPKIVNGRAGFYNSVDGTMFYSNTSTDYSYGIDFLNNQIYDCSGYKHNGTIMGSLTSTINTPRYSNSLHFNGSSCVYCQNVPIHDNMTFTIWIRSTNGEKFIIDYRKNDIGYQPFYIRSSNQCQFFSSTAPNGGDINIPNIYDNNWHHFAGTIVNGQVILYLDGSPCPVTTGGAVTGTVDLTIGGRHNRPSSVTTYFVGDMSDVRVYGRALNAIEIQELYNTSASVDDKGNFYAREVVE